ncbi:hypothetical protein D3C71_1769580 [compost metagenome]
MVVFGQDESTSFHGLFHVLNDFTFGFTNGYRVTDASQRDATVAQEFYASQDFVELLDRVQSQRLTAFWISGFDAHEVQLRESLTQLTSFLGGLSDQSFNKVHAEYLYSGIKRVPHRPALGW